MSPKQLLRSILPPILWEALRAIKRMTPGLNEPLTYAPQGWETRLAQDEGYGFPELVAHERTQREPLIRRLQAGGPLFEAPADAAGHQDMTFENILYLTCAYALALAAREKKNLKILDYGGAMGDHYWIARALLPGVALDYHCKELPAMAQEGRALTPQATWHTDDACLEQAYDLVLLSSSLQYIKDWRALLRRAGAAGGRILITHTSAVEHVPSYLAIQRFQGGVMLYWQFNKNEVLEAARDAGLSLVHEFFLGEHPPVARAPEQPTYHAWLFERGASVS